MSVFYSGRSHDAECALFVDVEKSSDKRQGTMSTIDKTVFVG